MKRVIAIGNFDGVHAGHKAIFAETCRVARAKKAVPAVLTFAPNPREYFNPVFAPLNIMSVDEKVEAMKACGIREVIIAEFNAKLAAVTAEDFAKDVLKKRLHATHVVTGETFVFGHKRSGNAVLLKKWLGEVGVGYTAVAAVKDGGSILSSSRIRTALTQGDIAEAGRVLGAPYIISGEVVHGHKRGKTMGFPTLNLPLSGRLAPQFGIYTATIAVGNKIYAGVASVGVNPTFGDTAPLLEAHAFTPLPQLYGQYIRVALHHFLRPEQRFENIDQLIDQIRRDVVEAKKRLKG